MSGLRSTLALCGLLLVIASTCNADQVQVQNCAQIESCFQYFEGACTSDGKRQVCLAFNDVGGTCTSIPDDASGGARDIQMCLQNNFLEATRTTGQFLCQDGDLVRGGEFYTFGIESVFSVANTDSRPVTITNYPNGQAECNGFTNACEATGNNDFTLRFRVSDCPTPPPPPTTTTGPICSCSGYSNVGSCSTTCGPGQQLQQRSCSGCNPTPALTRYVPCNLGTCPAVTTSSPPVDGMWGPWGPFGACSVTCGGGTRTRTRTCNNPPPSNGGRACVLPMEGVEICNPQTCDNGNGNIRECRRNARRNTCRQLRRRAKRDCINRECPRRG